MLSVMVKGIILFGDSVFYGIGAKSAKAGCGRVLQTLISAPVLIRAYSGETTTDALARLHADVLERESYSHVFVLFGNNDCFVNRDGGIKVPIDEFERNLRSIVRNIRAAGKMPLLSNLQPVSPQLLIRSYPHIMQYLQKYKVSADQWQATYSARCEKVAQEEALPLLDIRSKLLGDVDSFVARDGVHLNDAGHRVIADEMLFMLGCLNTDTTSCRVNEPF